MVDPYLSFMKRRGRVVAANSPTRCSAKSPCYGCGRARRAGRALFAATRDQPLHK
jgi:hypothetical protein